MVMLNYVGLLIWLFVWMIDQMRVRGRSAISAFSGKPVWLTATVTANKCVTVCSRQSNEPWPTGKGRL